MLSERIKFKLDSGGVEITGVAVGFFNDEDTSYFIVKVDKACRKHCGTKGFVYCNISHAIPIEKRKSKRVLHLQSQEMKISDL